MNIGKRLKSLRNKLGLSQKEMAAGVKGKLDFTYIGKIERGNQNPSLNILKRIADSFNIRVEYFFSTDPVEVYLASEKENNLKRNEILDLVYSFDNEEREFVLNVMNFIKRYKKVNNRSSVTKAAEKRSKYKK